MTVTGAAERVLALDDPRSRHPELAGAKAAHLARAGAAGLPTLPGFVVLPPGTGAAGGPLRAAWRELSADGRDALVVRSSSAQEDTQESSMAGQFASVLDVRGWDQFTAALRTVRESAGPEAEPIPVLVQPMVRSRAGGVLFGADPVAGRTDRLLVSVVRGGPDSLVSGALPGSNLHLSPRGRMLSTETSPPPGPAPADGPQDQDGPTGPDDRDDRSAAGPRTAGLLNQEELRRLAGLARRARRIFGGPQDIEFGFQEGSGVLWLFQSRPITAMAPRPGRRARLLGPGPVAETLPGVLQPLEEDLWVAPMAHGLAAALDIAGTAGRRRLRATPLVLTVDGRVAADLALLGLTAPARSRARRLAALLNPLPPARRLTAAWRVGRLRVTLPQLAVALIADVDRELAGGPPPGELTLDELAGTLRWTRAALVALHAQEALAGGLLTPAERTPRQDREQSGAAREAERDEAGTAAGAGLRALAAGRSAGLPDSRITAAYPEVLALTAPSLTAPLKLPALPPRPPASPAELPGVGSLTAREGLRLRVRWVQEYQVRLAHEVALRCGSLPHHQLALLRWPELMAAARDCALPAQLPLRRPRGDAAPLPDAFRLAEDGTVISEPVAPGAGAGQGVSGGRAHGIAWDGTGEPPARPVLVVRTLDPALAPVLPSLAGLLAQTGSPLSHLAVLAREFQIPAVTGASDAVRRFPPGTRVLLDGTTGTVTTDTTDTTDTTAAGGIIAAAETTAAGGPAGSGGRAGPAPESPPEAGTGERVLPERQGTS